MQSVAVTIVTHDSARYIGPCLRAVLGQSHPPAEVVIVDNASSDATLDAIEPWRRRVRLVRNRANTGFAAGQNQAMRETRASWVLALNPDVLLAPGFLRELLAGAADDHRAGSVCGKLLSMDATFGSSEPPVFDSTGMYFTQELRHFDRGWGEPDDGRYDRAEYVFGATGAAALYRRSMIDDISVRGDFFDPAFFAYREDADVAWRAQLLGWRCLYVPAAVGRHVRAVRPGPRGAVPPALNMHSVKNRFLLRVKNLTGPVWTACWRPALARDALVIGGCLFTEQRSLPAFWKLAASLPGAFRARREIMRRAVARDEVAAWFGGPVTESAARERTAANTAS